MKYLTRLCALANIEMLDLMGDAGFEPVGVATIRQAAPLSVIGPDARPQVMEIPVVVMKKAVETDSTEELAAFDKFTDLERNAAPRP